LVVFLAERKGFEPSIRCRIHTFQACAFDSQNGWFSQGKPRSPCIRACFLFVTPLRKAELSTRLIQIKKPPTSVGGFPCREEGIRTLDTLPYTHFPGVRLRFPEWVVFTRKTTLSLHSSLFFICNTS